MSSANGQLAPNSLEGVFVPVIPPLAQHGTIDVASLSRFVSGLELDGVNGFWVNGTMGEMSSLAEDGLRTVLETVTATTRLPVIAQVGANGTPTAVARAQHAEVAGAAAVSVITPYFLVPTFKELIRHLDAVRSSCSLPVLLYHYPALTQCDLSADQITQLIELGLITGMKDSSTDVARMRQVVESTPALVRNFAAFGASGDLIAEFHTAGCRGVVSGIGNILPAAVVTLWKSLRDGNPADALQMQTLIKDVLDVMRSNPRSASGTGWGAMYRWLMAETRQVGNSEPMPPTEILSLQEAEQLARAKELINAFARRTIEISTNTGATK